MQKFFIRLLLVISIFLNSLVVFAQVDSSGIKADTLIIQPDTLIIPADTIIIKPREVVKDTSWKSKTEYGANLNQGSFSNNWTGGGVNSIALGLFFNTVIEYRKEDESWRNELQTQYGIVKNRGQASRKNVDRIFFDTKYSRRMAKSWNFIGNINLLTQFAPGYTYEEGLDGDIIPRRVSGFFSPAYLTESVGIEYKPVQHFFITFSPGAVRQTIVADKGLYVNTPDQKNYGVPIGQTMRTELALMQVVVNFKKDIATNVNLSFRYLLFANYRNLGAMDNRLDATLTAKVNKYINVNLGAIVVYDEDQSYQIQYAQSLALGFIYKL
ncbi:DUF3078 domain-containing protein [Telluribacter sp. SYSU D00476]|uniref:DUF3078 domain-containing protein n=1 Tax=Telluribacter sp. SYSU D00476 TaxID=2811430 RepID=UPI001FF68B6B|nr:DUF3078 domain-containing protein [Telluribacter sp. SYSU D00476]